MAQLEYDTLSITEAVIGRLAECQDPRFKQVMTSLIKHLHAFARDVDLQGRRMDQGDRVPHRLRQDLRRQAAGVHPAVGHAGPVDAGGRAGACTRAQGPQRRHAADGCHGARAVLLGRRARAAAGRRHRRRRARRAGPLQRARHRPGRQAAFGRAAGHLVGRRRRRVRHAARRLADACARPHPHRRPGPLLVLVDPSDLLPGARRRAGGRHAAQDGPAPEPAGPHPHDGFGAGAQEGGHAPVRQGQPLPRFRRGVRRARQPGRGLRAARAGHRDGRPQDEQALPRGPLRLPPDPAGAVA